MQECRDKDQLLEFCRQEPIRRRHIVHELDPPCGEWDSAMSRTVWDEEHGVVVLDADSVSPSPSVAATYYVDKAEHPTLLVQDWNAVVRVEGVIDGQNLSGLLACIRQLAPREIKTYDQHIAEQLADQLGTGPWEADGAEYTPAAGCELSDDARVGRLGPEDRDMWSRFAEANADHPMVKARGGSQAVVRDFLFMSMGLPVDYFAAVEDGEMTGMVSANPMTRLIDEVSALFVSPAYRGKGVARSLLSAIITDISRRGHRAAYSAAGTPAERPDLHHLLTSMGCELLTSCRKTQLVW